jgi:hypothetical protein
MTWVDKLNESIFWGIRKKNEKKMKKKQRKKFINTHSEFQTWSETVILGKLSLK